MTAPNSAARRHASLLPISLGLVAVTVAGLACIFGPDLWAAWKFQNAIESEARTATLHGQSARALAQTCGLCHGLDGNGKSQVYPHLAGEPAGYIETQLNGFASGARRAPQMQPLAMDLTPQERKSIDRYYASFPATANVGFPSGHASDARAAAIAAPCAACHGAEFRGASAPLLAPRLAGQARDYLVHQLRAFRSGERTDPTGAMAGIARTLSDSDIDKLAGYLAGR